MALVQQIFYLNKKKPNNNIPPQLSLSGHNHHQPISHPTYVRVKNAKILHYYDSHVCEPVVGIYSWFYPGVYTKW